MTITLAASLREELEQFVDQRVASLGQRLAADALSLDFAAERFESTLDDAVEAECVALRVLDGLDASGAVALSDGLHFVLDDVAVAAQEAVLLELNGAERARGEIAVAVLPALSALLTCVVDAGGEGTRATLSLVGDELSVEAERLDQEPIETPPLAIALSRGFGAQPCFAAPWRIAIPLERFTQESL